MDPVPHLPRPIRFVEHLEVDGWRLKLYGISQLTEYPDRAYLDEAVAIARRVLPQPASNDHRYGHAFACVHQATAFNQVIVDWWEHDNELRHHVFKAEAGTLDFEDITALGEAFCIWELRILAFERDAWIREVLWNPSGPDLDAYASAHFSEDA